MVQETHDAPVGRAIGLLLFGVMAGLGLDLCAKEILETYSLAQFVFLRSLIGLAIFLSLSYQFGGLAGLLTRRWGWHLLRTILAAGAMFGFFYGLALMPLIDALTLGFTALRPGTGTVSIASLGVLFAAFCYACLAITARKLASTESTFSLSVYVVAGPMVISGLWSMSGAGWRVPDTTGWILFLLAGVCSVLAWIGLVGAYRQAPPSILAPFEYTALIVGAVAGYLIWGEVPDRWVIAGALVIIASGLFVVYRELGATNSLRYLRAITASGSALLAQRLARSGRKDPD
jgi:drug/metabolite transporter (DMT)-like permease